MKKAVFTLMFLLFCASAAQAADTSLEWRMGAGKTSSLIKKQSQISFESLFPIGSVAKGTVCVGPSAKFAQIEEIEQIGLGVAFGWRKGKFQLSLRTGVAWANGHIGEQTKWNYDHTAALRWTFMEKTYLTFGIGHISNGGDTFLNIFPGTGKNPGIDSLYLGMGFRF